MCKPSFKVLDKEHIVGIITNSNQFVKINEVIQNMDDDLDVIHGINEFEVDKELLTKKAQLIKRDYKLIFKI